MNYKRDFLVICLLLILTGCQQAQSPAETPVLSATSVSSETQSSEVPSQSAPSITEESSEPEESQVQEESSSEQILPVESSLEIPSSESSTLTESESDELDYYLGNMLHYLEKNLDKNDYGFLWYENHTILVYAVNEQGVKDVVSKYKKTPVEIEYIPAKYSVAQMDSIIEELKNVDFIRAGVARDEVFIRRLSEFHPGILIEWDDEVPQKLVDFMDTYPYRDCIEYRVTVINPCV